MSTLTTPFEDILIISDDQAPGRPVRSRWRAAVWIGAGSVVGLFTWAACLGLADVVRDYWRSQCSDNLRAVGLALSQYHEALGRLPAPEIVGRDGTKLLSWRVAILPYLGHQSLYERFHLDEPWDSPHNLSLVAEMPREFGCPGGRGRRAGKTSYIVIVGPEMDAYSINTAFEPTRGAALHHVTDGTSNSLLVLETDVMVPWTKPDELQWAQGRPLPPVASPHAGGTHMLFCDSAVRFIKSTGDPRIFAAILTINGGEVLASGG
jgi:Protein of unknown function (DUF1559)